MKLIIATHNKDKLREIRAVFNIPNLQVESALDYPEIPEVLEDGETLEQNAVKKASAIAKALGVWALADDSGLEVDALDGAPGVYSARYAGEDVTYQDNNAKLLRELEGVDRRTARFRSVIALCSPSGESQTVAGRCEGTIIHEERGDAGFGYDPVFMPRSLEVTFAEMDPDEKNAISHRGMALRLAREEWGDMLASGKTDWPRK